MSVERQVDAPASACVADVRVANRLGVNGLSVRGAAVLNNVEFGCRIAELCPLVDVGANGKEAAIVFASKAAVTGPAVTLMLA